MKKIYLTIGSLIFTALATLQPSQAEAFRVKIEPSLILNQFWHRPVARRQAIVVQEPVRVYRQYDPYTNTYYDYYYPCEVEEYVEYYPSPRPYVRSVGTDLQLKMKFK